MSQYLSKKLIRQIFTVFCITLLLLEVTLQFISFSIKREQLHANNTGDTTADIRILTLGESTTDNLSSAPGTSWPSQLEEMLSRKGYNVSLLNGGRGATTTTFLLHRLPEQLKSFSPTVVISMMGINDHNFFWFKKHNSDSIAAFFKNLKTVKLLFYILHDSGLLQDQSKILSYLDTYTGWIHPSDLNIKQALAWSNSLHLNNYKQTVLEIDNALESFTTDQKAQFYSHLAFEIIDSKRNKNEKRGLAVRLFEKSISYSLDVFFTVEEYMAILLKSSDLPAKEICDRCYSLVTEMREEKARFTDIFINRLGFCIFRDKQKDRWADFLDTYGLIFPKRDKLIDKTSFHYQNLSKTLRENNIHHIAMQYPLRPIERLKFYYKGVSPNSQPDHFLANSDNFRDAIFENGLDKIFIDSFAGDFGHTTPLGHSIIANNLFNYLVKYLGPPKKER